MYIRTHTVRRLRAALLALLVPAALLPPVVHAQDIDPDIAYYRFVRPGTASVTVSLWGDVQAPGRYEVAEGTDLIELLFLAGAPDEGVRQRRERRRSVLRVSRRLNRGWQVIYEAPLESVLEAGPDASASAGAYPDLRQDDLIKIETTVRRRIGLGDTVRLLGAVAAIVVAIDRLANN